jgi:hypothetical protein
MPNGRCKFHGGKSTGPRTEEGLEVERKKAWRHGRRSQAYVRLRKAFSHHRRLFKTVPSDQSDLPWALVLQLAGEEVQAALLEWENTRVRMQPG